MKQFIKSVGLDVHPEANSVTVADAFSVGMSVRIRMLARAV